MYVINATYFLDKRQLFLSVFCWQMIIIFFYFKFSYSCWPFTKFSFFLTLVRETRAGEGGLGEDEG